MSSEELTKTIPVKIALRNDNLVNWTQVDPILKQGEVALVTDENNNQYIKIGNGISTFTELKYVNEQQLSTNVVITKELSAENIYTKTIATGHKASAVPLGFAAGLHLSANANFSQALGFHCETTKDDTFSFVWNGDNTITPTNMYQSHGVGTFSINPLSGAEGFYIGDRNISNIISTEITNINSDVNTQLTAIQQTVQTNSNSITDHNTKITTNTNNINTLNSQVNTLSTNTTTISSNLNNLHTNVNSLSSKTRNDINHLSSSIDNKILFTNHIDKTSSLINSFEIDLLTEEQFIDNVLNDVECLSNHFYVISSDSMNCFGSEIINVGMPMSADSATTKAYVDNEISTLTNSLTVLNTTVSTIDATVETNIANITTLSSNVKQLSTNTKSINSKTTTNTNNIKTLSANVSELSTNVNTLSSNVNILSTHVNTLSTNASTLSSNTATLSTNLKSVTSKTQTNINNIIKLSASVNVLSTNESVISTETHEKIYISDSENNFNDYTNLSVIKLNQEDYNNLVASDSLISNALYLVSSDYIDAYGSTIQNLTMTTDDVPSEAVNKNYVDTQISEIKTKLNSINIAELATSSTTATIITKINEIIGILNNLAIAE